jgi:hypothetical protein
MSVNNARGKERKEEKSITYNEKCSSYLGFNVPDLTELVYRVVGADAI